MNYIERNELFLQTTPALIVDYVGGHKGGAHDRGASRATCDLVGHHPLGADTQSIPADPAEGRPSGRWSAKWHSGEMAVMVSVPR